MWAKYLPWAEFHYNTSTHSASGLTPFEVIYGKPPPVIPNYLPGTSLVDACDTTLTTREEILALLRKKLIKAQQQMKLQADKHRRDTPFEVGSWVYVKLQPYRQTSLTGVRYHKLSKRFYGPYLITARIGPVVYKLALPSHSKIHNVFHCSKLKLHEGELPSLPDSLPSDSIDNHPLLSPLAIIGHRTQAVDGQAVRQVLVQWQGLLPDDNTWEDWEDLRRAYNLEDKVVFEEEGIDMNGSAAVTQACQRPKRVIIPPKKLADYKLGKY
jgi:hypothetical protein